MGKVLSRDNLEKELTTLRARSPNLKIVFTNGCFDLLHVGHVQYLREARKLGDLLVLGLNSDASVRVLKGPTRPLQNENDRSEIMAELRSVDYVSVFAEETPLELIQKVKPNVLVKGGDWKIEQIVGADFVQKNGGQVFSLCLVEGKSTTKLVEKAKGFPFG